MLDTVSGSQPARVTKLSWLRISSSVGRQPDTVTDKPEVRQEFLGLELTEYWSHSLPPYRGHALEIIGGDELDITVRTFDTNINDF